jgi:hypothetical protein
VLRCTLLLSLLSLLLRIHLLARVRRLRRIVGVHLLRVVLLRGVLLVLRLHQRVVHVLLRVLVRCRVPAVLRAHRISRVRLRREVLPAVHRLLRCQGAVSEVLRVLREQVLRCRRAVRVRHRGMEAASAVCNGLPNRQVRQVRGQVRRQLLSLLQGVLLSEQLLLLRVLALQLLLEHHLLHVQRHLLCHGLLGMLRVGTVRHRGAHVRRSVLQQCVLVSLRRRVCGLLLGVARLALPWHRCGGIGVEGRATCAVLTAVRLLGQVGGVPLPLSLVLSLLRVLMLVRRMQMRTRLLSRHR